MYRKKKRSFILSCCILLLAPHCLYAQMNKTLSLSEVFDLAVANSKLLKLSQAGIETAQAATRLTKTALSPSVDVSFSALYLGNAVVMDRDFTHAQTFQMPHLGNNFAIEASQVIFAGGAISTSIKKAKLEEQLAQLNHERNELDICFLVTGHYLDLYQLKNQREVFLKNIEQTELLINEIKSKESQGMALGSDVTRHELMLQNLKLALIEVDNNAKIINHQLVTTLGLPDDTRIVPDSSVLKLNIGNESAADLLQGAMTNLPELKSAALNKEIAAKSLQQAKADYYPQIALLAANNFNGPILVEVPTINSNLNYWYLGIGLRYNLASLYKTDKKLQMASKQQSIAQYTEELAKEHAQIAVHGAYTKFKESYEKLSVYETSSRLAQENYRIINNRYLSELVLISEMLDASNAKLNAELQVVNARLNVIYCYYKLQREIGNKVKK